MFRARCTSRSQGNTHRGPRRWSVWINRLFWLPKMKRIEESRMRLARVGIDRVAGYLKERNGAGRRTGARDANLPDYSGKKGVAPRGG